MFGHLYGMWIRMIFEFKLVHIWKSIPTLSPYKKFIEILHVTKYFATELPQHQLSFSILFGSFFMDHRWTLVMLKVCRRYNGTKFWLNSVTRANYAPQNSECKKILYSPKNSSAIMSLTIWTAHFALMVQARYFTQSVPNCLRLFLE